MKVIDLLNKIANKEETPKYIKYFNKIDMQNLIMMACKANIIYKLDENAIELNDEVEVIEDTPKEHKKIKKINILREKNCKNNWKWKIEDIEHDYNISTPQKIMCDKINEIIDRLNGDSDE